ncbi:hypothetical protein [Actinosynnema sp. NPDC020468]
MTVTAGGALVSVGVGGIYGPAGLIAGGLFLVLGGLGLARSRGV